MKRVGIHCRISHDAPGDAGGTARQEAACRRFAEARGWVVSVVFVDNDVSAYRDVDRPAFGDLSLAVICGDVDGVLFWKLDRLVRRPVDSERFWELCQTSGVWLTSVTEPIDTSTDLGVGLVRVLVAFASTPGRSSCTTSSNAPTTAPPTSPTWCT